MRRRTLVGVAAGLALAASLEGSAAPVAPSGFVSELRWSMPDPLFGGFSAIEVSEDGSGFTAITDRGGFTSGRLSRDAAGTIIAITAAPLQHLLGRTSVALTAALADSEGLAIASDGAVYVSFEGIARVLRYARLDGPGETLPIPAGFRRLRKNAGLEALAIDADGTLYSLPERSGAAVLTIPVHRFRAGVWDDDLAISRAGDFLPVAADIGPDQRFYLLERRFRGFPGFSTRLRRFSISPDGLSDERTLFETPSGLHDNLEGISVWRDHAGNLRATMISDDNFIFLQRTEVVEYLLSD